LFYKKFVQKAGIIQNNDPSTIWIKVISEEILCSHQIEIPLQPAFCVYHKEAAATAASDLLLFYVKNAAGRLLFKPFIQLMEMAFFSLWLGPEIPMIAALRHETSCVVCG